MYVCVFRGLEKVLSKNKGLGLERCERSPRRATSQETLVEAPGDTDVQTVRYTWVFELNSFIR